MSESSSSSSENFVKYYFQKNVKIKFSWSQKTNVNKYLPENVNSDNDSSSSDSSVMSWSSSPFSSFSLRSDPMDDKNDKYRDWNKEMVIVWYCIQICKA